MNERSVVPKLECQKRKLGLKRLVRDECEWTTLTIFLFLTRFEFADDESHDRSPLSKAVGELETKGVRAAETGDIAGAMKAFEEAIRTAPGRASCYNNRAQALRLLGRNDGAYATKPPPHPSTYGRIERPLSRSYKSLQ